MLAVVAVLLLLAALTLLAALLFTLLLLAAGLAAGLTVDDGDDPALPVSAKVLGEYDRVLGADDFSYCDDTSGVILAVGGFVSSSR